MFTKTLIVYFVKSNNSHKSSESNFLVWMEKYTTGKFDSDENSQNKQTTEFAVIFCRFTISNFTLNLGKLQINFSKIFWKIRRRPRSSSHLPKFSICSGEKFVWNTADVNLGICFQTIQNYFYSGCRSSRLLRLKNSFCTRSERKLLSGVDFFSSKYVLN